MSSSSDATRTHDWPEPGQYRRSIRLEFSLYASALILALMIVTGYIFTQRYVTAVTESVVENLLTQARSYAQAAGKPIIAGERPDVLMLNNICTKFRSDDESVYWVGIFAPNGSVFAHTDVARLSSEGTLLPASSGDYDDQIGPDEALAIQSDTIYVRAPIVEQGITVGHLQLASSAQRISEVRRESIITVSLITLLMLAVGIPVTMILTRRKLKPVKVIANALRNVDLDTFQIDPQVHATNELGFLAETLRVMGRRLGIAQADRVEKERRDRELEIARDIQRRILPKSLPSSRCFEFSVTYDSAKEVGGDYYDVIDLGNGEVAFIVADVSGKSLPGMLVMLMTRDIVRNTLSSERQPATVLSIVNREIRPSLQSGMFVTMFYGLVNTRTGELTFASAGHNPLIHLSEGGRTESQFKTKGYPLGMMPPDPFDRRIETGKLRLSAGDLIVQYTDGMNEAQSAQGQDYGMERFTAALKQNASLAPAEYINAIMAEHHAFVAGAEPFDDVTLLVMKWNGVGSGVPIAQQKEAVHVQ